MDPNDPSPVILIRHGLSKMNIALLEAGISYEDHSEEKTRIETDPNLIDAELHPIGILQCEAHQNEVN